MNNIDMTFSIDNMATGRVWASFSMPEPDLWAHPRDLNLARLINWLFFHPKPAPLDPVPLYLAQNQKHKLQTHKFQIYDFPTQNHKYRHKS